MDVFHVIHHDIPRKMKGENFLMSVTVTDKLVHGIYVGMKNIEDILSNIRSNINTQKEKYMRNMKLTKAERNQKKEKILWLIMLPLKKFSCQV